MGSILSRNQNGIEELDTSSNASYIFPPVSGSYFAPYFYMGGKKFDSAQPECYLFGENSDLNFLGPKPSNFSYQIPPSSEPIKALKCLVNIRKDSLRLIKVPNLHNKNKTTVIGNDDGAREESTDDPITGLLYNIEFTFDADCPCFVNIFYQAQEEVVNKSLVFSSKVPDECSKTMRFNAGCNQQFCLPAHKVLPSSLAVDVNLSEWNCKNIPIAIQVTADCGEKFAGHSHVTYASFEKLSDQSWTIKLIKQKQVINGVCYLLQEIYGIENKVQRTVGDGVSTDETTNDDLYDDDNNSECVVCLSDTRDTLILPCKHLCLCSECANQLRFQQSGCPICRQPFRALLQIRAVRKKVHSNTSHDEDGTFQTLGHGNQDAEGHGDDEHSMINVKIPDGYEVIPLITGINETYNNDSSSSYSLRGAEDGPSSTTPSISTESMSSKLVKPGSKKHTATVVSVENEVGPTLIGTDNPGAALSSGNPDDLGSCTDELEDDNDDALSVSRVEEISVSLAPPNEVETGEASHASKLASLDQVVLESLDDTVVVAEVAAADDKNTALPVQVV